MKNLIFILLFFSQIAYSNTKKDSLFKALRIAKQNKLTKEVANTYKEVAKYNYFQEFEYDSTIKYSKLAFPIYQKLKDKPNQAYIYKLMGYAYVDKENYNEGIAYLDSALILYRETNVKLPIIQIYTNKGIAYSYIGKNEKSIKAFEQAIELSKEINDSNQLATNLLNIGIIYSSSGKYPLAIDHLIQACDIFEQIQDSVTIINTYLEIGDVYQTWDKNDIAYTYYEKANKLKAKIKDKKVLASLYDAMGYTSEKQNNIEKAQSFYNDLLKLSKEIDYKAGMSQAYYRIGNLKLNQKDYQSAINNYNLSLGIEKEIGSIQGIVYMKNLLASTYNKIGAYSESLSLLRESRRLCLRYNLTKEFYENNKMFYETFKNMELSDSALYYYEKYVALEDSIYGEKQELLMEELREKYETEKKENTILNLTTEKKLQQEKLARQRQRFVAFIVIFVLLLLTAILFYMQQKRKEENRKLQIKQKLLRSQMNPHFIFNALNSIKNFMLNNEKNKAADYMVDFSQLIRQVLDGSIDELKNLDSELSLIKNYLNLQQLRYNHVFHFEFSIDDKIPVNRVLFPSMFLQPFIENSVVHGISGGGNKITIEISKNQDILTVNIIDNGPGYINTIAEENKIHKSRALEITRERVKILKKLYGWKVQFTVITLKENSKTGTMVSFKFPYKES
ncbi:MAG: tetratricopeptide repeat protein [Bacteroidota bacterium]|nr:tetratricopeptide repeat protein [Bacteroidota bacterium]